MKYSRQQIIDFIVLALRFYLAFFMIDYGWSKATGGQFHIWDPKILDKQKADACLENVTSNGGEQNFGRQFCFMLSLTTTPLTSD